MWGEECTYSIVKMHLKLRDQQLKQSYVCIGILLLMYINFMANYKPKLIIDTHRKWEGIKHKTKIVIKSQETKKKEELKKLQKQPPPN